MNRLKQRARISLIMFKRAALFASLFLVLTAAASGQDPTKAAPDSYKLQFENDWVKVLRVHYGAHSKVPVHDHSTFPAAYVYLSDAGPIKFIHTGWNDPILTRRPVKAKAIRLSPTTAVGETHQVENSGDLSSDFLRIELKSRINKIVLTHSRFAPEDYPPDKPFEKVLFENDQVRISRMAFPAGKPAELNPNAENSLIVILSDGAEFGGSPHRMGDTVWLTSATKGSIRGLTTNPVEFLRFDFK